MIQSFQWSLTGLTLQWYIIKKINLLETREELSDAFLKLYKFYIVITSSREDPIRMEKKKTESFKTYATRWRALAAQTASEPTEKQMMHLIMKTLPYAYRSWVLGSSTKSFTQLVPVGKRIEIAIRDGWPSVQTEATKSTFKKEKEPTDEFNVTWTIGPTTPNQAQTVQGLRLQWSRAQPSLGWQRNSGTRQYTPLPWSLSQILFILLERRLLAKEPKHASPKHFPNYDPSKTCDYHLGEIVYSVDDCVILKNKVRKLLDVKMFSFCNTRHNHGESTGLIIE